MMAHKLLRQHSQLLPRGFNTASHMLHNVAVSVQGVANVELTVDDVAMILNTLDYDGQIEEFAGDSGEAEFRRTMMPIPENTAFSSVPCGRCPVSNICKVPSLTLVYHPSARHGY